MVSFMSVNRISEGVCADLTMLLVDTRKNDLLRYLGEQQDVSMNDTAADESKKEIPRLPEIDIYLHLLVMIYLLDNQKYDQVGF